MTYSFLKMCALIATVFYVIWIVLFLKYRHKYDELLDSINSRIFTLKEVYFLGLGVIEAYENITGKRITEGERAAKRLKEMSIIFGEESAELYYYVYRSATISLLLFRSSHYGCSWASFGRHSGLCSHRWNEKR